jgi:DNA-binding NarL/FixJ family response regulator
MKIFLVDDSASVRQSVKKLLSGLAHVRIVGEAETACVAQRLIENSNPEVVILDIVLKEGSGFDVLKEVKNREKSPLVIVLTNYATLPFRKKAEQEGADFFFDKSTEFEKMIEVLKQKKTPRTIC